MRRLALVFCVQVAVLAGGLTPQQRAEHLLARATYGARPGDAQELQRIGWKKWLDQQLHPERIPGNPVLQERLRPLESLTMQSTELVKTYPQPKQGVLPPPPMPLRLAGAPVQQRRDYLLQAAPVRVVGHDLVEAKIDRALLSTRQLEEVLADFWFNHFNVFLDKGADRYLVTSFERDAIRPHVLGKFRDLLQATARHPAMLFYLDNWLSVAPGTNLPQRRGLNENYARELLELHTLGVDGGYTQQDVIEVARCFTGWTIRNPREGGAYFFAERLHDRDAKTVLGVRITAGGEEDGLKVLDLLARHPSTARFISRKLAQRFVSDDPPKSLVEKMAAEFRKTDGDIRQVLRVMFYSKEFWSADAYRAKVKSPLEFVMSAARSTEADVTSGFALAQTVARLGQPLYREPAPTGYSNESQRWLNASALVERMNFATALTANRLPGVRIDPAKYGNAGLRLGGPEFQKR